LTQTTRVALDDLRVAGALLLAAGVARGMLHSGIGMPCPLRAITGVPCPLCGMTTSVTAALRVDVPAAISANPAGLVAVLIAVSLLVLPRKAAVDLPRWVLPVALLAMWVWQLFRFHIL